MTVEMEVEWKERKRCKEKGEESCPGPGGKNIQQGSFHRIELGNRTAVTAWGQRIG
jgi:hypothetical protein